MATELARLAQDALTTSDFKAFGDSLATQTLPHSFGVLTDTALVTAVERAMGGGDLAEWVTRPLTWNAELYDPKAILSPAENLLHLLWQDLHTRLARKLDAVARRTSLAPRGAVLCFFGRAQFSIVVEYARSIGGAVSLRPLTALNQPNGVLELTSLLVGATGQGRNALKKAALSTDKLIFQRGSIIHVDRQREDVFGPTIDTVILGELIAEWFDLKSVDKRISALEVGPGSGHLSTILASSSHTRELTAVDLNGSATTCTLKNLEINDVTLDAKGQSIRVRAERFALDQLTAPFDFIVCNPPYIPDPPISTSSSLREYGRAAGGLDLSLYLLQSLPMLLSTDGVLLLMTSSISSREVLASIPDGFEAMEALAADRRVPLDVDVVWRDDEWRSRLLADQRIEQDGNGDLWHLLRPLWIKRRMVRK